MSAALWVVYDYEVDMFTQMYNICTASELCHQFPQQVQNAIVESMLLHLRILVDIWLSKRLDKDDITLTDLLPSFKSPLIAQLKAAYGNRKTPNSPCWEINKRLAHPTKVRSSSYSYNHVLKALIPIVEGLLNEVNKARP